MEDLFEKALVSSPHYPMTGSILELLPELSTVVFGLAFLPTSVSQRHGKNSSVHLRICLTIKR